MDSLGDGIEQPDEQPFDFKSDRDYPLGRSTPKAALLRSIQKDIAHIIPDRGEFAHFPYGELVSTSQLFFDCGLASIDELKLTRSLSRTFMREYLRNNGRPAKEIRLFTSLLAALPSTHRRH